MGVRTLWERFASLALPRALSVTVIVDSEIQIQSLAGMESWGHPQLADASDSCSNCLESHSGAEGERIRVVQS